MVAAIGAAVQMQIDQVLDIARSTMARLESDTIEGTTSFKNIEPGAAHFSSVPLAVEFHAQQQAAKDIFVASIEGIVQDLQAFAQQLEAAGESTRAADEAASATLAGLGETFVQYDYATDVNFEAGRSDEALNSTGARANVAPADVAPTGEGGGADVDATVFEAPTATESAVQHENHGPSSGFDGRF